MKIKSSTVFLALAALGLGGVVLIVQQQPAPKSASQTTVQIGNSPAAPADSKPILDIKEADIQAFTLQTRLRTLKFERNKDGKWQMLEPTKTAASDPSIAFLLDLVATGHSDRAFTAPATDREQYGLHQPIATIELSLKDQKMHKLVLGAYDFNRSHLYAQVDPPASSSEPLQLLLVSPNFDKAVNRPLDEWKQPAAAAKSDSTESKSDSKSQPSTSSSPESVASPQSSSSKASPASPAASPSAASSPSASASP
jgi:hypothetical protein